MAMYSAMSVDIVFSQPRYPNTYDDIIFGVAVAGGSYFWAPRPARMDYHGIRYEYSLAQTGEVCSWPCSTSWCYSFKRKHKRLAAS